MSAARIIIYMCALVCLLPGAASVHAAGRAKVALPQTAPLTADCIVSAASSSGMPLAALVGILAAENGRTGEALLNDNGTFDLGPFQINTIHVNALAEMGIAPETVLQNGCINAYAAAWRLRQEYDRTGDIWQAVGGYHSRTPHRRDAYIAQVKYHLARFSRSGIFALPLLAPGKGGGQ